MVQWGSYSAQLSSFAGKFPFRLCLYAIFFLTPIAWIPGICHNEDLQGAEMTLHRIKLRNFSSFSHATEMRWCANSWNHIDGMYRCFKVGNLQQDMYIERRGTEVRNVESRILLIDSGLTNIHPSPLRAHWKIMWWNAANENLVWGSNNTPFLPLKSHHKIMRSYKEYETCVASIRCSMIRVIPRRE